MTNITYIPIGGTKTIILTRSIESLYGFKNIGKADVKVEYVHGGATYHELITPGDSMNIGMDNTSKLSVDAASQEGGVMEWSLLK